MTTPDDHHPPQAPQGGRVHTHREPGDPDETRTPPTTDPGGPLPPVPPTAGAPPGVDTGVLSSLIDLTSPRAQGPMGLALELCRRFPLVAEHLPIRLAADRRARMQGFAPHRDLDPTLTAALDRLHEDDVPARPAPPEAMLSPEGWREWYAAMPEDAQLAVWRVVQSNQGDLHRCWVEGHDARIEWLERAWGEALNVPSGGARLVTGETPTETSVVIQTPDHGDRNTTSRNTAAGAVLDRWWDWSQGDEPTIHDAGLVQEVVSEVRRALGIATEDDEPAGPPPEPMPVTSFDCFLVGHHNQYATDHTAEECADRCAEHVIPMPQAFVQLAVRDAELRHAEDLRNLVAHVRDCE